MEVLHSAIGVIDAVTRETLLFAATGFVIGGIDDVLVDAVYGWRVVRARLCANGGRAPTVADFRDRALPGRIAIFVPAWDEAGVIGAMLMTALARFDHPDYRIYVGTYPNDSATIDAVASVAASDHRVRLVVGAAPGPTTKADCLNSLWRALTTDEAQGEPAAIAVVLHDAEDVVHPDELRIFAALIGQYRAVQLPVLPLTDRRSRWVAGHYCDEFAEAHAKQMVVRTAIGAGMPLAGVGCAIARPALNAIAARRNGTPFDASSLTEDYELGLALSQLGGGGIMARIREAPGGALVAVRAHFPARLGAAVRQKARWMTGIALAGWDRIGWSRGRDWSEHWMRMRDRRAPIAVLVLAAAYIALVGWGTGLALRLIAGEAIAAPELVPAWLLGITTLLLGWRLAMRALFTARAYGWREGLIAVPRALVGNLIALLAARRAIFDYIAMIGGRAVVWDKTAHVFPEQLGADLRR